ncbi:MAG: phosphoribosylformylglycinamidine cyclo-ligase [Methanobacteriota archaeon]|nr:MAG: phosphoribosylformylglycinamidine cyclo-ligase [Euryarchaeota archaeon]
MTRISTYAQAGVNRMLEETAVSRILSVINANSTSQSRVNDFFANGIEFGDHIFSLSTDGVGSKVLVAELLKKFDTIGIDCVAMNVNDLIATGSIPQGFVDYIAIREPDEEKLAEIIKGVVEGCNLAEIPLLGGETAILPDLLAPEGNIFDLSGTAFGIQLKENVIDGSKIQEGDVIIGIESSGIHSNGLTLARKLFEANEEDWLEKLLTPTRIYVKAIKKLLEKRIGIKGMAHITGGGFRNLFRLGSHHYALQPWSIPEIFSEIQKRGDVAPFEMFSTFNMGIGFVMIVDPSEETETVDLLNRYFPAYRIGVVKKGDKVTIGDLSLLPRRKH